MVGVAEGTERQTKGVGKISRKKGVKEKQAST